MWILPTINDGMHAQDQGVQERLARTSSDGARMVALKLDRTGHAAKDAGTQALGVSS